MATFSDRESQPYLYLTIEGIGPRTDATGTVQEYRWSTFDPGFGDAGVWRSYLSVLPSHLESSLDVVTGEVKGSGIAFDLIEGSQALFLTDVLATHDRTRVGRLALNASAAVLTLDVTQVAGGVPAVNDVLWIGREACRITVVVAGGGTGGSDRLTVTRGRYGTTAHAHNTSDDRGDSEVRYRPHFLRGRGVTLRLNFRGNAEGSAVTLWRGYLDRLELVTGDEAHGAAWRLHCAGVLGLLDTVIGTRIWTGSALRLANTQNPRDFTGIIPLELEPSGDMAGGRPNAENPLTLRLDSNNEATIRAGKTVIAVFVDPDHNPAGAATISARGIEWAVRRSPREVWADGEDRVSARQVLVTDPFLDWSRFRPDPPGAAVARVDDHPVVLFLCLALSTGAGTNLAAGGTNYDVLAEEFGAGIPVARFDMDAWEAMIDRVVARMPNLVVFYDGPINLMEYAQKELLGPIGIGITEDEDGLIAPLRISEVTPADSTTAISEDDVVPRSEAWSWDFDDQVGYQTWLFDHDGPEGDPVEFRVVSAAARVRYQAPLNRTLEIEARGLTLENGQQTIVQRAQFLQRHFQEPAPQLTLSLTWDNFRLPLGSAVLLTHNDLPNPRTGTRTLSAESFLVVGKRMRFSDLADQSGGGVMVRLFWVGLDAPTEALWAPAAEVDQADFGTGTTVTVVENAFTDGFARGSVVADDTDAFQVGGVGVGDLVLLQDPDGVIRNDNVVRLTARTATTLTIDVVFSLLGVEVNRNNGDIVAFVSDTGGPTPASAWTARMQQHAALADDAALTIGTTTRVNHYID